MKVGEIIAGRYELCEQIGKGGCSLFIAQDRRAHRRVAVRIFDTAKVTPDALQRYTNVLAAASAVDHPAVVLPRVQVATFETPPFVVGEALEGENLRSVCGRLRTIPWERAVTIVMDCLAALIALEAATGLAHRALRPGAVWLGANDGTQILDFGAAELGALPATPRADGNHAEYRAPEQLEGAAGDARSDIFSLGVMLFEMLTGVYPFAGPNAAAVRIKILMHAAPRPSQVNPRGQLPEPLESLVVHMLARRSRDRPTDYATLMQALSGLLPSPVEAAAPTAAPPPESPPPPALHTYTPIAKPAHKPRVEERAPAFTPPEPDTTLILPQDPSSSETPLRTLERTLMLPTNDGQDIEDQRTLMRANPRRHVVDRTEIAADRSPRAPSPSRTRTPALEATEPVPRSALVDASEDVTEIRVATAPRPAPTVDRSITQPTAPDEDITTYRPRPPPRAAANSSRADDPTDPTPGREPPAPSAPGEPFIKASTGAVRLTAPRLVILNVVLLAVLLGLYLLAR